MALVAIIGAARCGKSDIAENLAKKRLAQGEPVSIAVFGNPLEDPELADAIERHKSLRPEGFRVIEAYGDPNWLSEANCEGLLLVDSFGTALAAYMENPQADPSLPPFEAIRDHAVAMVDALCSREGDTIVVIEEVGAGVVPSRAVERLYRELVGACARRIVNAADAAYWCVAGRVIEITDCPQELDWPED